MRNFSSSENESVDLTFFVSLIHFLNTGMNDASMFLNESSLRRHVFEKALLVLKFLYLRKSSEYLIKSDVILLMREAF